MFSGLLFTMLHHLPLCMHLHKGGKGETRFQQRVFEPALSFPTLKSDFRQESDRIKLLIQGELAVETMAGDE